MKLMHTRVIYAVCSLIALAAGDGSARAESPSPEYCRCDSDCNNRAYCQILPGEKRGFCTGSGPGRPCSDVGPPLPETDALPADPDGGPIRPTGDANPSARQQPTLPNRGCQVGDSATAQCAGLLTALLLLALIGGLVNKGQNQTPPSEGSKRDER